MSRQNTGSFGSDDRVEQVAAEWYWRRQAKLDAAEETEFEHWIKADARHAEVFSEMEATAHMLDELGEENEVVVPSAPDDRVVANTAGTRPNAITLKRWRFPAAVLAAAAALAIVGTTVWRRPAPATFAYAETTEVGGLQQIKLPDGSELQLNTASAIEVDYSATERRIKLTQGEAFFSVAKDPQRPFWVEVAGVSVRAVGTAFNVRYRENSVEVMVTEGKVRVGQGGPQPEAGVVQTGSMTPAGPSPDNLLVAGYKADIPLSTDGIKQPVVTEAMGAAKIMKALAWREHRIEFASLSLAEVAAEFNRYNRHKLVVADPALAAQQFGGVFDVTAYDSFIEALQQAFGVTVEVRGGETILRKGR